MINIYKGEKRMSHQQATVLIAPSHIHDQLRIMLAQNNQQLSSVTILTLSAFLKRELSEEIDTVDVILKYRDALRSYPAKCIKISFYH